MPPPAKRRKQSHAVDEVVFNPDDRQEYLTGFHRRKQQRIKHAQEEAAKKERAYRIEERRKLREQRRKDLEKHVQTVNEMVKKVEQGNIDSDDDPGTMTEGEDNQIEEGMNSVQNETPHEDEYVDEDKYTTVTIRPMEESASDNEDLDMDRGIKNGENTGEKDRKVENRKTKANQRQSPKKPTKKRKKFKYENKEERKAARVKEKSKKSAAAKTRRQGR